MSNTNFAMAQDESTSQSEVLPAIDESLLGTLILQKLDQLRAGDLYVQGDLEHDSYQKLLNDDHVYKKFESIIAKTWMDIDLVQSEEKSLNGGKLNRKKKIYVKALQQAKEFVREQIGIYIQAVTNKEGDSAELQKEDKREKGSDTTSVEEDTVSSLSDAKLSRSSSSHSRRKKKKRKKKKKHKEKRKSKKRKRRISDENSDLESENGDDGSMSIPTELDDEEEKKLLEKAKALFEKEKKELLERIPNDVKKDFRSVCFTKWTTSGFLPSMQLGPFDVRPGEVRDQWMSMFHNTLKNKRKMTRLVFWYGTPKNDLSSAYSLVPESKIITYEEACKKKLHEPPPAIAKKMDKGQPLTAKDRQYLEALEQINADAKLDPSERSPWLFDFEEEYDYSSDVEDELRVREETKKKPSKKQKSKVKDELKKDDLEKKKRRKRKSATDGSSPKPHKKVKTLEEEIEEEVAEEDAMMKFDVSSESDRSDEDFSDKNDDDFDQSESEVELDKDEKVEKKSKKQSEKRLQEKPKKKKDYLKSPEEIEQELFENCEEKFLPIMSKLDDAKSESEAKKLIKKIERDVKTLTPAFVRTHQIGLVVKRVRIKFKDSDEFNQMCKQLTSKMKQVYNEKLNCEPEGFQPKVRKKKKVSEKKARGQVVEVEKDAKVVSPPTEQKDTPIPQYPTSINSVREAIVTSEEVPEPIDTSEKSSTKKMKPAKTKPARKSFSLAGMIERKPTPTPITETSVNTGGNAETSPIPIKAEQPEWTVNYQRDGNSHESNNTRKFAMEFLMDAVSCLPKGKVDPTSVAHALEDALHKKYGEEEIYFERLHDICAAIAGKTQMGSLAQKIIAGSYATPLEVIEIPRKTLFQSFEGAWIP